MGTRTVDEEEDKLFSCTSYEAIAEKEMFRY